jgi:hypothetical protein
MTRPASAAVLPVGLLAAVVVLAAGCSSASSSGGNASGNPDGDILIGCMGMGQGDVYMANMTKPGTSGHFQFVLQSSMPTPPAQDPHTTWVIQLLDPSGKPLPGAMFTWLPGQKSVWMPAHNHGSGPPVVTDNGDGTYTLTPLYFFMPGLWQVTLQVSVGMTSDSAVYSFCLGG